MPRPKILKVQTRPVTHQQPIVSDFKLEQEMINTAEYYTLIHSRLPRSHPDYRTTVFDHTALEAAAKDAFARTGAAMLLCYAVRGERFSHVAQVLPEGASPLYYKHETRQWIVGAWPASIKST